MGETQWSGRPIQSRTLWLRMCSSGCGPKVHSRRGWDFSVELTKGEHSSAKRIRLGSLRVAEDLGFGRGGILTPLTPGTGVGALSILALVIVDPPSLDAPQPNCVGRDA